MEELRLETACPFCRTPLPASSNEYLRRVMKRAESCDPMGLYELGCIYLMQYKRCNPVRMYQERWNCCIVLVHLELQKQEAYDNIARTYKKGTDVDMDMKKASHYEELAAIGGDLCWQCEQSS